MRQIEASAAAMAEEHAKAQAIPITLIASPNALGSSPVSDKMHSAVDERWPEDSQSHGKKTIKPNPNFESVGQDGLSLCSPSGI